MKLDFKVFGLGALLGVLAAVAPGCGGGQTGCNSTNCANGCCSEAGACLTGASNAACGSGGAACVACTTGNVCAAGACVPESTGGGTGGGGMGGGTGGGMGGGTGGGGDMDAGTGGGGGDMDAGTGGGGGDMDAGTGGGGGDMDAGTGGGGGDMDAGTGGGGGSVDVNAEIATIRAEADMADGGTLSLPVDGALVTYVKPLVAGSTSDPAGFFIQGQQLGPAVFVAIDPATLSPVPAAGDSVSFTATSVAVVSGLRQVTALTGFTRNSAGNPVSGFVQNVSSLDFTMVTNLDDTESELTSLTGAVTAVGSAGAGYSSATLTTTGTTSGTLLRLRLPTTLQATEDLRVGCTVSFSGGPMWRFNTQAQPSAWNASELAGTTCPAPKVTGAEALNATTVRVTFDRNISSASVTPGAFTITGGAGLTVSGAMTSTPNQVVLTTSAQTSGTTYTVTVANTVTDTRGTGVDQANNTAMFLAARANDCTASVVISQFYPAGGNSGSVQTFDFIELHNRTNAPVDISGWALQYQAATGTTTWSTTAGNRYIFDGGVIPAGGYFLVQGAPGTNDAGPLPATPDVVSALALGGTGGKLALVGNSAGVWGCPVDVGDGGVDGGAIVDFVGYGNANCAENDAPVTGFTNAQSLQRNEQSGAQLTCVDTNSNSIDFVAITPAPRNSATAVNVCTCP